MRRQGDAVSPAHPYDAAILADYWLAMLPEEEESAVEEHLLACDQCGARLREVIALADALRSLADDASLRMVVSDGFLQRAAEDGLRIREYTLSPGDSVLCTVTAEDDMLVARMAANLAEAGRVDLSFCDPAGVELFRMADIPVDRTAGGVIYQESITFAKASPSMTMIARLVTADERGGERLLAEYTLNHTRSLPDPGTI